MGWIFKALKSLFVPKEKNKTHVAVAYPSNEIGDEIEGLSIELRQLARRSSVIISEQKAIGKAGKDRKVHSEATHEEEARLNGLSSQMRQVDTRTSQINTRLEILKARAKSHAKLKDLNHITI